MTNNKFKAATWGKTYNLAGAEWTPVGPTGKGLECYLDGMITIREAPHDGVLSTKTFIYANPLLPSHHFVNAQSDPRAVAIAALERAGFAAGHFKEGMCPYVKVNSHSTIRVIGPECRIDQTAHDPALSRYAQECFEVLHAWASKINWEAK